LQIETIRPQIKLVEKDNTNRPTPQISKAVPLQAWGGPEGSRKLRFPDFMTTTQDGG
jgi:hypothetical protein